MRWFRLDPDGVGDSGTGPVLEIGNRTKLRLTPGTECTLSLTQRERVGRSGVPRQRRGREGTGVV